MSDAPSISPVASGSLTGLFPGREAMWFLVGRVSEHELARQLPIYTSPFQIGRRSNTTLCLPCNAVSSVHAELVDDGHSLILKDLGSTNGTFVNGQRIRGPVELKPEDLVQFASFPFRIARQTVSPSLNTVSEDACDYAMLLVQFDKLMAKNAVVPHYQPIVDLATDAVIGQEVLARSSVLGLESAASMFRVASQLNLQTKLSEMMRWKGVQQVMSIDDPPHLFLNTHPSELTGVELVESVRSLRELSPRQPLTLEIHEAAVAETGAMKVLRNALSELNVGFAFDDFGAGQARLLELAEVRPDYLKFDISLVRDLHRATAEKVQMVGTLVRMVRDMNIVALAEGIQSKPERDACIDMGFTCAQGYYFGRPIAL